MKKLNTLTALCAFLVGLVVLFSLGCNPPPTDGGDTNVNVTQIVTGPGSPNTPTSPPPGSCPSITRIGVSATLNGAFVQAWRVGEEPRLDATPLNASTPVAETCHGNSVQWSLAGTATCTLTGDTRGFIPGIRCSSAGSVEVTATVAAPGGVGGAVFTVQ